MFHELATRLEANQDEMVTALVSGLQSQLAPHYQDTSEAVLSERARQLVRAFVEAFGPSGSSRFLEHMRRITEERIAEGVFLREVQLALNILGERSWHIAAASTDRDTLVRDLGAVSAVVGMAKDLLARIYLERKERVEARLARLDGKLFAGTQSSELPHDPPEGKDP